MLCVGSKLLGCGGSWACSPHWNVIYMLEMAVEGGRGGDWIIGGGEKRGHKEGPDHSPTQPVLVCVGTVSAVGC